MSFITREKTVVKSHSLLLKARSPVFRSMLDSRFAEGRDMVIHFESYPESLVKDLLHFISHDEVLNMTENACDLLVLSEMYQLDKLKSECECYLVTQVDHDTAFSLIEASVKANSHTLVASLSKFYSYALKET